MVVLHSIFRNRHGPPLFYLHGKKPRNTKKSMLVRIMNGVNMNSKIIMNSVCILNGRAIINNIFQGIIMMG